MAIRLNAQILNKKVAQFNSPRVDGLKMINTRYYIKNPLRPVIESHQFINNGKINAEFSSKTLSNGDKFEVYRTPEETVKLIQDKLGKIKAFKSSIDIHNQIPGEICEKMKESFTHKTHNFLA